MNNQVYELLSCDNCDQQTKTFGIGDEDVLAFCEICLKKLCPTAYKKHVKRGNIPKTHKVKQQMLN